MKKFVALVVLLCAVMFSSRGDNPNNQLGFLVNNDGAVSALGISTQCPLDDDAYFKTFQAGEVWGATLLIVGLTQADVRKIAEEYLFSVSNAIKQNPYFKRYQKTFSAYSVQTKRLIVSEVSVKEIRPGVGEFRILMRAYV